MALITPPAPLPLRNAKWRLIEAVQVNRSAWTGTRKVVGLPGAAYWTVSGQFVPQRGEAAAKPWRAFFMALRGQANSFLLPATETSQTSVGVAQVGPGATAGNTLPVKSLPPSQTILQTGDLMTVGLVGHDRLVCLTAPLISNSSGTATATFVPELGSAPAEGFGIVLDRPWAQVSLTSEPSGWDVDVGQIYGFTLNAEEAR